MTGRQTYNRIFKLQVRIDPAILIPGRLDRHRLPALRPVRGCAVLPPLEDQHRVLAAEPE